MDRVRRIPGVTGLALALGFAVFGNAGRLLGQAPEPPAAPSATDLAKATQNPVGDLTSVPFQFNFFSGGPLADRSLFNLNFQPVVPFNLGEWNLISRTIVPYLDVPGPGLTRITGVGDIQEQLFFSPAKPGGLIWGVGPILSFPTATNDAVKTGDWAAGPAVVLVKNAGSFVLGALLTQLWTFADNDDVGPHLNQFLLQPFVNYNLANGWALAFAPSITANWANEPGEKWTVPLGLGVSKVTVIGHQPVSLAFQYYNNVTATPGTGRNQVRFAVSFLFPNPPAKK